MAYNGSNPNHLLVGLGGTGGKVLKAFKKRLYLEHPDDQERASMRVQVAFIYVDSTTEMMRPNDPTFKVMGKDASFRPNEFVNIKNVDLGQILDNIDSFPGLKYVVRSAEAMKTTLGEVGAAAGQKRRAGRILFASNCNAYLNALSAKYTELQRLTRQNTLHVHIFTGLAGGTGSGSIVDVVAQTRMRYPEATIDVYAMVPEKEIPAGCQAGRYHQNGYAALMELSAMNVCKFLPSDVISGDEHVHFNEVPNKQFGLMLYSNENENGVPVDSFTELPVLLADAAYFRIFLKEKNGTNDTFLRSWSAENYNDFLAEYNFRSKSGDKERARTKAVSSFGIKRVMYPETRIIEHISYVVSQYLVRQMQFNNFSDDKGFLSEPVNKNYVEQVENDTNLREWRLNDSYLRLNEKILETEQNVKAFKDIWQDTAFFNTHDDAKKADSKNPCGYNYKFCADAFEHKFRQKKGAVDYFKAKRDPDVIDQYVSEIIDKIEAHLYSKWFSGQYSMYDLSCICEAVLSYIKKRSATLDGEITKCKEEAEELLEDHNAIIDDYANLSITKKVLGGKGELYAEDQTVLAKLFETKTKAEAIAFQSTLMAKLKNEFEEYQKEVMLFIAKLAHSQEKLIMAIADRTLDDSAMDVKQNIVEVAETDKISSFEQKLIRNKNQMDSFAGFLRKEITKGKSAHFAEIANAIDDNTIMDIAMRRRQDEKEEPVLFDLIVGYHTNECSREKILGLNVLKQLKKILDTPEKVHDFARDVITQSGVFLLCNQGEMAKAFPNNPNPVAQPHSINRESVIICMPSPDGDDSLKQFADDLRQAFSDEFHADGSRKIEFDISEKRKNEITVVVVKSCFPIRVLKWIPDYAKEYHQLINDTSEGNRKYARMLLHVEGDGTQLPLLEGEGEGPRGNDLIPYLFIAASPELQLIKFDKDENENEGWCTVTEGDWGIQTVQLIAKNFTSIIESEEFTSDLRDTIVDKVDEYLSDPSLKKSSRDASMDNVKSLMKNVIFKECSSTTSPKFKLYGNGATKALEMIQGK